METAVSKWLFEGGGLSVMRLFNEYGVVFLWIAVDGHEDSR